MKLIIENDQGEVLSKLTFHPEIVKAFMKGRIIKIELGNFDGEIKCCTHARAKVKKGFI